jgi:hypothetical protein
VANQPDFMRYYKPRVPATMCLLTLLPSRAECLLLLAQPREKLPSRPMHETSISYASKYSTTVQALKSHAGPTPTSLVPMQ